MPTVFPVDKDGRSPFTPTLPRRSILLFTFLFVLLVASYLLAFPNSFTLAPRQHTSRPTLLPATFHATAVAASASSSQQLRPADTNTPKLPQITLDPSQELGALTSFLASHYQNVIPPTVDASLPIDPDLVLDFDTRGARAAEELQVLLNEVWVLCPVVLYGKHYNPASREIKKILSDMHLRPPAVIFNVDTRDDSDVLAPIIYRLTGSSELPVLLIGGKPVGSIEQIRDLNENGELHRMISDAGAVISGSLKKKKGKNH